MIQISPVHRQILSLRALRGAAYPAFMLALALGAILALFGLFNAAVLSPVPIPGQARLVSLNRELRRRDGHTEDRGLSPAAAREAGDLQGTLDALVQGDLRPLRVEFQGTTRSCFVGFTSPNYFTALGLRASLGTTYGPDDAEPGAVLSHAFWKAHRELSPGANIVVDGVGLPVLGVAAAGFEGLDVGMAPELWVPFEARIRSGAREARFLKSHTYSVPTFGRLRPGRTCAQAEAALQSLVPDWKRFEDPENRDFRAKVRPHRESRLEAWKYSVPMASALWAGLGVLLAMAILNLGSLQVARWMSAREELATRSALGASPWRLALELGAPLILPLGLGFLGSLPIALAGGQLLSTFAPPSEYPVALHLALDFRVLGLALGLTLLALLALQGFAWIWILRQPLHVLSRHQVGRRGQGARKALLTLQVALSMLLLSGTLASWRELNRAARLDLGYSLRGIRAYSFAMPSHVPERKDFVLRWNQLCDHFQAQPGLEAASVCIPPCEAYGDTIDTYRLDDGRSLPCTMNKIHPGTFRLLGIPLLEGRDFRPGEGPEDPAAAIIERRAARRLWPGGSALGATLIDPDGRRLTVVGVVGDHRWSGPLTSDLSTIYLSARQRPSPLQTLLIKGGPRGLDAWVEREVARVDPRLAITRRDWLSERLERKLQPQRLAATLFAMTGFSALILCLGGLYALQRHAAIQRMPELGLRMALGASPQRVILELLSGVSWLMGSGIAFGLLGTWTAWRLLASRLAGLPPLSLPSLLLVAGLLGATALIAAFIPSLRAARTDPATSLRSE